MKAAYATCCNVRARRSEKYDRRYCPECFEWVEAECGCPPGKPDEFGLVCEFALLDHPANAKGVES